MSDPRHSTTSSTLRARGRHALPWLRRNRANRWKVLLAPAILGAALLIAPAFGTTYTVCVSGCAFTSIQDAIDDSGTQDGDTILIGAGTYAENVIVNKRVILDGAGSTGVGSTVIDPPSGRGIEITVGGASINSRVVIQDVRVTDSTDGVWVSAGASAIAHLTISNVVSTANTGNGLHFAGTGSVSDAIVAGSVFSSNSGSGIRIASAVPSFDGLSVTQTAVSANGGAGFDYNPSGTVSNVGTNFTLEDVAFSGDNTANGGSHEVSLFGFHGNATLRRVTVTGAGAAYGIVFSNNNTYAALGSVLLDDVTVDGTVKKGGLTFQYYSTTPTVTLTNVKLSAVTAPWGQFILDSKDPTPFPLGTTTLKTANIWNTGGVNATSATFKDASTGVTLNKAIWADNFQIEDQVGHRTDAGTGGLVSWNSSQIYAAPLAGAYGGIQKAITAATAGDTVNVRAGEHTETLTVNKALTLRGPNYGISPNSGVTRAAEAYLKNTSGTGRIVTVSTTDLVTIDGFKFQFTGTDAGGQVYLGGVLYSTLTNNKFNFSHNIIADTTFKQSPFYTTSIESATISDNRFTNYTQVGSFATGMMATWGSGSKQAVLTITDNVFSGLTETASDGTPAINLNNAGGTISGNLFTNLHQYGILLANKLEGLNIVGNTFNGIYNDSYASDPTSYNRGAAIRFEGTPNILSVNVLNNRFVNVFHAVRAAKDGANWSVGADTVKVNNNLFTAYNTSYGAGGAFVAKEPISFASGVTGSIEVSSNYWGQSGGPDSDQLAGGTMSGTGTYLNSSSSAPITPGFWPVAEPAPTVTAPLTTTSDAPPVAAAVSLPGGGSTSLVLDFGEVNAGGNVVVEPASQPSDGNFSFAGNTPISITFSGTFTPPVKVCLSYDDSSFPNGATPALWHYSNGAWSALPTVSLDTVNKVICANTDSFSIFVPGINATDACALNGDVLEVTIPSGLKVGLEKTGSTLTVTFDPTSTVCGGGSYTIGGSPGQIRTVQLTGSSGNETVTFSNIASTANWGANSTSNLFRTIDLGSGTSDTVVLEGTSGNDALSASGFASLSNVEIYKLDGLGGDDSLTGTTGTQYLYGGPGADFLRGDAGDDFLFAGAGNDSMQGGTGSDCVDYSTESASVTVDLTGGTASGASIGSDVFGGIECARGGSNNDTITGSGTADTLYGGDGDDTISGRGGNDSLYGEGGTDTISFVEQTAYGVTVNLASGLASGTGAGSDTFTGFENATGGTMGDTITGSSGPNALSGGPGADSLIGGDGNDTLNGDGGSDTLTGGLGDDTLNGGDGTDTASYASEPSAVTVDLSTTPGTATGSGIGSDTIATTTENATGGSGADLLTGSGGANTLSGGLGGDTILGGGGNDLLYGGADNDNLQGEAGGDTLYGDAGTDVLRGGADNDLLYGGLGDDTLVGGAGNDLFYGQDGSDTVSYDDSLYAEAASSAITFNLSLLYTQQGTGGAGGDSAMDPIENLTGSSFNDKLYGSTAKNVLLGLAGNDYIFGNSEDDTLDGGAGTNTLDGGAGLNDTCTSGPTKLSCEF